MNNIIVLNTYSFMKNKNNLKNQFLLLIKKIQIFNNLNN